MLTAFLTVKEIMKTGDIVNSDKAIVANLQPKLDHSRDNSNEEKVDKTRR